MRNPIRSETDAFRLALGSAAVIGVAIVIGAFADPLVGVALVAGCLIGAFAWEVTTKDPGRRRPLREAAAQGRDATHARPRVLVVANRTLRATELRDELRRRATRGAELHLVAPILASRAHYIASDVDGELADARSRLSDALAWARSEGLAVTGDIGDPNAALGAIEDALRVFGPDEVIIATLPPGRSNWLETGIVARLEDELDIPVTHLVAEPAPEPERAPAPRGAGGGP
jgi:GABA permease